MLAGAFAALYWTVWLSSNDMVLTKLQFNLIYMYFSGQPIGFAFDPSYKGVKKTRNITRQPTCKIYGNADFPNFG